MDHAQAVLASAWRSYDEIVFIAADEIESKNGQCATPMREIDHAVFDRC